MNEWLKLVGVAIVIIGFALRWRTTIVVVIAGIATGLLAGLPLVTSEDVTLIRFGIAEANQEGLINMLGRAFVDSRLMTLFVITLPAIGLAEKYGLQHEARGLIARLAGATVGRLPLVYQLFRVVCGALGLRLNGHPTFVRPLLFPMAAGALEAKNKNVQRDNESFERTKAACAAAENYGNFYGQNLNPAQAGVLLVFGVMQGLGVTVSVWSLVWYSIPVVLCSVVLGAMQFVWFEKRV